MDEDPGPVANAAQIESWNGRTGERWVELQDRIDALFRPLMKAVVEFADPAPGERVLDVGCGCGASLLALADRLGPEGQVTGVDVSRIMLDVAARRTGSDPRVRVMLADASSARFAPASFDLLFSRFGVMFFDDPIAAFAHLRAALAPGGRLAFVAWRPMAENPWFMVPFAAVAPLLPDRPQADPFAPGPFGFADPERVRDVLEGAGFGSVKLVRHNVRMPMGEPGGLARAASFASQIGPTANLLAEADDHVRAAALEAIHAALAPHETAQGLSLGASVWLVSARA